MAEDTSLTAALCFRVFLCFFLAPLCEASCEKDAVGLANGYILDSQLSASTDLSASAPAKNGRLNYTAGSSWCASTSDSNPYLQIDLQTLHIICAVSTQGNSQRDQWVETYTLQSSTDGTTWTDYNEDGKVKATSWLWYNWDCGTLQAGSQVGSHQFHLGSQNAAWNPAWGIP